MNKDILEMLQSLEEIREINPDFGCGPAGWISESDDADWCED